MSKDQYDIICHNLKDTKVTERLRVALGVQKGDEKGALEVSQYISGVLMEIQRTVGDEKKDLTKCTDASIIQAMIDAASFKLPIDGRQLAHLVKYGNKASFQPGYRGYLYKISEIYEEVDFTAEPVFEGDELSAFDDSGFQSYNLKRKDPFQDDQEKMVGIVACLSYKNGDKHRKVAFLSAAEIAKIRKVAKQDYIWKEWFFEKAKVAALKRLCKIHFASVMGVQELIRYDNDEHFDIVSEVTPENPSQRLKSLLPGDSKPEDKPEGNGVIIDQPQEDLSEEDLDRLTAEADARNQSAA